MADLLNELISEHKLHRMDGETGVRNLARLVRMLGYKDPTYFGQFAPDGAYGDLINFLEDNSGAIEKILEFIQENEEGWKDEIESHLPEREEEDEE